MTHLLRGIFCIAAFTTAVGAQAQVVAPATGTLVAISADGEVKHVNDQARATLLVEEQDKDKAAAASRVNQKMKQGTEIIKREDPQATLTTRGYYTFAVYPDEPSKTPGKARVPVAWRVGQYLDVVTTNLSGLPKTVAAAQRVLALNGLSFSLSDNAAHQLDDERIQASYRNLTARIASVARAMGRKPADAVIEVMEFDGASAGVMPAGAPMAMKSMRGMSAENAAVEEPSFEPGETTLHMQIVGKIRFR
jgi:predicted secreted protein